MSNFFLKHQLKRHNFRLGSLLVLWLGLSGAAMAQTTLKGKITDASGSGVPGVSVRLESTNAGGTSNAEGDYSFSTNVGAGTYKLNFSFIGYKSVVQNINIGAQSTLTTNVSLQEEASLLDEVVVTGSTISANRRTLGNAITTIKSEQIQKTGTNNLLGALQGKVAGAQITQNSGNPDGGISIRLRGVKSLQGNSDPLYVIDGVVMSNASDNVSQLSPSIGSANPSQNRLADLNPNDIESLNIINGAAAAAQYGSRASNGVVLITTKRGKSGAPKVNFSTSVNMSELRKGVFISTYGKQFGFAGLRLHTIGAVSAAQVAANPGTTTTSIVRDGVPGVLATNLVDVTRYNYFDQIFRTAYGTDNSLSISGGNDKTQYYASLSYMKNEGIVKGADFSRYSLRLRVDQRLADWAKLSAGISYSNSLTNEKPNGNVFFSPINAVTITNNIWDISQRDAAGGLLPVEPTRLNPLSAIEAMDFTQSVNRTINDLQLNLTPIKGLSIDGVVGLDTYSQVGRNTMQPYPYAAAAGLPAGLFPNGFAGSASNQVFLLNTDLNVTYDKQFGENLKMTITAGFNYQYSRKDFSVGTGEGLAPFITTVSGASTNIAAGYGLDRFWVAGQFAQATFGYKNRLFVTGAIRRDGASIFSKEEINQLYPKVSASYVLSDEDFWKNGKLAEAVSSAKLRASFGDAGGLTALGTYDRFWQFSPVPYLGRTTILPSTRLANERVRPERMRELEIGGDFGFMKDRITLGITAYRQNISDLIVNQTINPSSGGLSKVDNVGEMENRGLEISLGLSPVRTKDLEWDLNFIYSANRNKITKLPGGAVFVNNAFTAPDGVAFIEGQPASVFVGRIYARNPDGSLLLTPQGLPQSERGTQTSITNYAVGERINGQPSGPAFIRTIVGNPNPDYTASILSNVRYKNLNFRVLFDAVQGVSVFNADKRTRNNVGIGDLAEAELRGEAPRGTVFSLVPIEEYRVDNGSFVKLRELSLSYSLPQLIKRVNNLTLTFAGRNLISWDKYNGFDPETNAGGNSDRLRGTDFGNVPIPRSYQLTLSASF